jgi:FixJ family two-component response regulator
MSEPPTAVIGSWGGNRRQNMTKTENDRVFLVGTPRETTQEVMALLQGQPYSVTDASDGMSLLAEPQRLMGNCVVLRDGGSLRAASSAEAVPLVPNGGPVPVVVLVGNSDVRLAVDAVKRGASDVVIWPAERDTLVRVITDAFRNRASGSRSDNARVRIAVQQRLTSRERDVLERLVQGNSNKAIGVDLGISERTVEVHRANIMRKLQVDSFAALIRLSLDVGTAA